MASRPFSRDEEKQNPLWDGSEFIPAVEPSRYRLFQVADIICTLELIRQRLDDTGRLTESENAFFAGTKNFRKNYLKLLDRKIFK